MYNKPSYVSGWLQWKCDQQVMPTFRWCCKIDQCYTICLSGWETPHYMLMSQRNFDPHFVRFPSSNYTKDNMPVKPGHFLNSASQLLLDIAGVFLRGCFSSFFDTLRVIILVHTQLVRSLQQQVPAKCLGFKKCSLEDNTSQLLRPVLRVPYSGSPGDFQHGPYPKVLCSAWLSQLAFEHKLVVDRHVF